MRGLKAVLVFCFALALTHSVYADDRAKNDNPSAFTYAYRGLLAGALVGLSAGYLGARSDGFERNDWKPMAYGVGFGALGGTAVGLTLGLVDLRPNSKDIANVALKDTICAGALGTLVGAIGGGLVAIGSNDAEHVALGAAIGTLSGAATGLTVGVIRGHFHAKRAAAKEKEKPKEKSALHLEPSWSTLADTHGRRTWLMGASGRF